MFVRCGLDGDGCRCRWLTGCDGHEHAGDRGWMAASGMRNGTVNGSRSRHGSISIADDASPSLCLLLPALPAVPGVPSPSARDPSSPAMATPNEESVLPIPNLNLAQAAFILSSTTSSAAAHRATAATVLLAGIVADGQSSRIVSRPIARV